MTSQLNSFEGVFIAEEILRAESYKLGNAWEEGQSWLMKAFSTPVRSYGHGLNEQFRKPQDQFYVLGGTLNPFYADQFLNWTELGTKLPNLKLVLYRRSNVVKHAVSYTHRKMLREKCGTNVVRKYENCRISRRFPIDISQLRKDIFRITALSTVGLEIATGLATYLDNWFFDLKYEELLRDDQEV